MKSKNVITVSEIIKEVSSANNISWNDACNVVDFCKHESTSENWDIESVNDFLEDEPDRIEFIALKKLMKNKKEVLIIND